MIEEKEIDEIKVTQQNLGKQVNAISQQMESLISMLNANKWMEINENPTHT